MNQTRDGSVEIYINSAVDKVNVSDTLSEWTSYLPIPVELENNKAYGLSVQSASICNTFPQFHETERRFKLDNTEIVVNDDIIFTNTANLCSYLSELCVNAGIDALFTVDGATHRVRIKNNSSSTVVVDLGEPYVNFWKKMGFRYDLVESLTSVAVEAGGDILLRYIATIIPTQRVFIVCDQVVPNSSYPTDNNRPIVCSIDLQAGYGSFNFAVSPYLYEHDLRFRHAFNSLSF